MAAEGYVLQFEPTIPVSRSPLYMNLPLLSNVTFLFASAVLRERSGARVGQVPLGCVRGVWPHQRPRLPARLPQPEQRDGAHLLH